MSEFDPYHIWLGIPETERPISKYRLLGIADFEDNREVISAAAERQTIYLRTLQAGEHSILVAELLNEVSQARVTLLNEDQKAAYDEELRKQQTPEPVPEPTPVPIPVVRIPAPTPVATPVSQPKPTPIPVVQTPAPLQNIPLPTSQTSTPFATPKISITTPRHSQRRVRGKVFKVAAASVIGTVTVITLLLALSDYSRTPPKLTPEQLIIMDEERAEFNLVNQKQVEIDQLVDDAKEAWKADNYSESDRLFKAAIAVGQNVEGNLWDAYHSFARSYEAREDYPNALIQTRKAILASDNSDHLSRSTGDEGVFLFRIGDHDEGQVKLEQAIEITPNDFWNVYYMGRELRRIGRESDALSYLEQAVRIDKFQGNAQLEIARILTDREEYLALHKVYIELERSSKAALENLGEAESERIRGIVESPWYWDRRAFASSKLGNWQDVLAETNRGLAIEADGESDESLVGLRTLANQRLGKTDPITSGDANSASGNSGVGNMGSLPKSLTTGLLLYLPLDGKYAFADPGDQNDHQLKVDVSGAVLTEDRFGRRNGAYRFDGKDDRIVVEYGGLPAGDSARSIAVSFLASGIRLSSQGDPLSENLVSLGDGTFGLEAKRFSLGIRGEELFLVGQNRDRHFEVTKLHDQWCTYIVRFKGEIGECYVNGVPVSRFEHKLDTASAPLVIGSNTLSRNDEFFKGTIDEVLVYDRAMSLTEIKALDSYLSNKPTPKKITTIQGLQSQLVAEKKTKAAAETETEPRPRPEPNKTEMSAEEQYQLATKYYDGRGVGRDYTLAAKWYRLAAEQGNRNAQSWLGVMYRDGDGVTKNYTEALKWLRLAANQKQFHAQNNLGAMYRAGRGVPQDYKEAVKWFRLAAAQGFANAQYNLGARYYKGEGVAQNYTEAIKWFRLAAGQGYAGAQNYLGIMYDLGRGVPQDYKETEKWYRLAAAQGYAAAQSNLGRGYYIGKNYTEAIKWYRLAAAQGYATAQHYLGVMYKNGFGVPLNYQQAYIWLSLAAANGQNDAERHVEFVRARLSPSQLAEAQERASELFKEIEGRQKLE